MILLVDNHDSFTYILRDYLAQIGLVVEVVKIEKAPKAFSKINPHAVVLSPGPGNPIYNKQLLKFIGSIYEKKPILGICLGCQALGYFFGARLKKALRPMHGKISNISIQPAGIFNDIPERIEVTRYHSLILAELPKTLAPLAYSNEGELMAFAHKSLPVIGIQFHPEAYLTQYGLQIFRNWAINNKLIN